MHKFEHGNQVQARDRNLNFANLCGEVYSLMTVRGEHAYRIRFAHGIQLVYEESLEPCAGNEALTEIHTVADSCPHLGPTAHDRFFNLIRLIKERTWDEVLVKVKEQQALIR